MKAVGLLHAGSLASCCVGRGLGASGPRDGLVVEGDGHCVQGLDGHAFTRQDPR